MNNKARIASFDFARAICTVGIIFFHFSEASACFDLKMNLGHLEAGWGYLFVTAFFMISGALMYYQHDTVESIREFYVRRWLTIFPSFFAVYVPLFLLQVIQNRRFFFRGRPWTIILSIVGLDGYFSQSISDYYLVGEWFLGAILILYALYPLLLRFFNRSVTGVWAVCLLLFFLCMNRTLLSVSPLANIFSCLLSFVAGMLVMRFQLYRQVGISLGCAIFLIVVQFVRLPINPNILMHAAGFAFFFVVVQIGEWLTRSSRMARVSEVICSITYEIYLIHHIVIVNMLDIRNPAEAGSAMLMLLFCNLIIIPAAFILKCFRNHIPGLKLLETLNANSSV